MLYQMANWECPNCQVLGRSDKGAEVCWFCGSTSVVTYPYAVWVDTLGVVRQAIQPNLTDMERPQ